MGEVRKHAIVVGGSMGGLLAARVLSDFFEQVTLIDRDAFPEIGQHRRGVPQSVHTHGLLAGGRRVIEDLFPGISSEVIERGGLAGDILNDSRWHFEGACLSRKKSGLDGLLVSRPLLEGVVRKRTLANPKIKVRENTVVDGLESSGTRVTGVRLSDGAAAADLVVDSTGRGSHSPAWLESIGFTKPEEEKVEVGIAYTTRLFRRTPQHLNGDSAAIVNPTAIGKRGGVLLAQEGHRWICTLTGYINQKAPADMPGFIEYARSLPGPDIHAVVSQAEPIGEAFSARFPASIRRRYERLKSFPEGYLIFGDAICSFNPVYGQGMSVASQEAHVLHDCLAAGAENLAGRFFTRAAKVVDIPWSIAVGADLRIPEAVGPRSAMVNFLNWYIARLHRLGHRDPEASVAFLRVANLLAPPPSILHPRIALRVLAGSLRSQG